MTPERRKEIYWHNRSAEAVRLVTSATKTKPTPERKEVCWEPS